VQVNDVGDGARPPEDDADVPALCRALGVPVLADIHMHFLPTGMLRRVWEVLRFNRHIGDSPVARGIKLSLGGTIYDPADSLGKMFFNILATFAEFEVDLLQLRTREGMAVARAKGKLRGQTAQAHSPPANRAQPACTPPASTPFRRGRRAGIRRSC
jgi:hypothetical protein